MQNRLEVMHQPVLRLENRRAPTDNTRRRIVPQDLRRVEEIGVPQYQVGWGCGVRSARLPYLREVLKVRGSYELSLVPVMRNSLIAQEIRRPLLARITWEHVVPDGVHAEARSGIRLEQRILRPPGTSDASGSSRRDEQHEPHEVRVSIESGAELG